MGCSFLGTVKYTEYLTTNLSSSPQSKREMPYLHLRKILNPITAKSDTTRYRQDATPQNPPMAMTKYKNIFDNIIFPPYSIFLHTKRNLSDRP